MSTPSPLDKEKITKIVRDLVSSDAAFVYLYGSFAAGTNHPESDVDLGIYFKDIPLDRQLELRKRLICSFPIDVDLVDLRRADPIIVMQIIANGVVILQNDSMAHAQFVSQRLAEYFDLKRSREIIEKTLMRGRRGA